MSKLSRTCIEFIIVCIVMEKPIPEMINPNESNLAEENCL